TVATRRRVSGGGGGPPAAPGFAAAAGAKAPASAAARTPAALRSRPEALAPTADQALSRELDDTGRRGGASDRRGAGVMLVEQPDRGVGVIGGHDHAEAAAHVEHLVQLGVVHATALGDLHEHAWHLQRGVDQI